MRTGGWMPLLSATYAKSTGTLLTSEDTISGYYPIGSIPHVPVRLRLMAEALVPNSTGKLKNSSYVEFVGSVIPGA